MEGRRFTTDEINEFTTHLRRWAVMAFTVWVAIDVFIDYDGLMAQKRHAL
jgi:hypothetical protein